MERKINITIRLALFISFFCSILNEVVYAQKPALDTAALDKWPSVGSSPLISNNGKYVDYIIHNKPMGSETLVIKAVNSNWERSYPGVHRCNITDNSKIAIFLMPGDSLCLLPLGTAKATYIAKVKDYRLFKLDGDEVLAYQQSDTDKTLVLHTLSTGQLQRFDQVDAYLLGKNSHTLIIQRSRAGNESLCWVDLPGGKEKQIWEGKKAGTIILDNDSRQLAFITDDSKKSIWLYKRGDTQATVVANDETPGIDSGLVIDNISRFSNDGERIFASLKEVPLPKPKPGAVMVDIWSWQDAKLQSQQLKELGPKNYVAVVNLKNRKLTRLQLGDEKIMFFENRTDEYAFVSYRKGHYTEEYWNPQSIPINYLINCETGKRRTIPICYPMDISPDGLNVIGFDREVQNLYCFNIITGNAQNLIRDFPISLINENDDIKIKQKGLWFAGWKGKTLLLYDQYDLWELDLSGHQTPVCLTHLEGRKKKMIFRLIESRKNDNISDKDVIILSAFDCISKKNGFYQLRLRQKSTLKMQTMENAHFYSPSNLSISNFLPIKARNAKIWIISKESSQMSPNYYSTSDFKCFNPISNIHPEYAYNWLKSELVHYYTLNGIASQGILYKPENLDSAKKYPVILHYYENKSDLLNSYLKPELSGDNINIPWFVSRGYYVFTPDVHFATGKPGESALNAVVGAAKELIRSYNIDSTKMGLQGHSFGGYETNYIITHTKMFSAAMAASAVADIISSYGQIRDGKSKQSYYENGQGRMGNNLWESKDIYIKNSPIFNADQVTTPILLMNNKKDEGVKFEQGVEFYIALRRLEKKVWMLQYDGEGHSISFKSRNTQMDYTLKMDAFFDHYLKNTPAPKWMSNGIPAKLKGIDSGLELDTTNKKLIPGIQNSN